MPPRASIAVIHGSVSHDGVTSLSEDPSISRRRKFDSWSLWLVVNCKASRVKGISAAAAVGIIVGRSLGSEQGVTSKVLFRILRHAPPAKPRIPAAAKHAGCAFFTISKVIQCSRRCHNRTERRHGPCSRPLRRGCRPRPGQHPLSIDVRTLRVALKLLLMMKTAVSKTQ